MGEATIKIGLQPSQGDNHHAAVTIAQMFFRRRWFEVAARNIWRQNAFATTKHEFFPMRSQTRDRRPWDLRARFKTADRVVSPDAGGRRKNLRQAGAGSAPLNARKLIA
jgi:hypothetical protein